MNKKRLILLSFCTALFAAGCSEKDDFSSIDKEKQQKEKIKEDDDNSKNKGEGKPKDEKEPKPSQPEVNKPSDYYMASRMQLKMKEGVDIYDINFDRFYRKKDKSFMTSEYLSRWFDFYSSTPNSSQFYTFTQEDISNTKIIDVSYESTSTDNGRFYLTIEYKDVRSDSNRQKQPYFSFSQNEYFKRKVIVNREEVAKHYFYGTYRHASEFLSFLVDYDTNIYELSPIVGQTPSIIDSGRGYKMSVKLEDKETEEDLAKFEIMFTSFKSLDNLNNELAIYPTKYLSAHLSRNSRVRKSPDGDITKSVENIVSTWSQPKEPEKMDIQFKYQVDENTHLDMALTKGRAFDNGSGNMVVLEPATRLVRYLDLKLYNPRFEIVRATKRDSKVDIDFRIIYINEESWESKIYKFSNIPLK